ncbi:MAG: hypothetical protein WEA58_04755 [Balneolaceae bacterium]
MKFNILICLFLIPISVLGQAYSWEKEAVFNEFYNPFSVFKISDDDLLIYDTRNTQQPINQVSLKEDSFRLTNNLSSGQGPGEVNDTFYKRITTFSNGNILLWDRGQAMLTIYDDSLNYISDLEGGALQSGIIQAGLINDSTLVTVENDQENVFKAWKLLDNETTSNEPIWTISFDDYPQLNGLRNFILMQAMYFMNYDGFLYVAFEHSSVILALDADGIEFINDKPDENSFPEFDSENPVFSLPNMGSYVEGTRDLDVDGDYIYIIYKGESTSKWEQLRYRNNSVLNVSGVQ